MQKWEYLVLVYKIFSEDTLEKIGLRKLLKSGRMFGLDEGWYWEDYIVEKTILAQGKSKIGEEDYKKFLDSVTTGLLSAGERLPILGANGWELVSVTPIAPGHDYPGQTQYLEYVFKRPLEN